MRKESRAVQCLPKELIMVLFIMSTDISRAANVSLTDRLYTDIFTGYNRKLFPVLDPNTTVNVSFYMSLVSINNFDEISGELHITCIFYMTWNEERIKWEPGDYGGQISILVPPEDLWRPQLYVLQAFDKIHDVGNISLQPRLMYNGTVIWDPGMVLRVSCSVDVTYFPFDTQHCVMILSGWSYISTEIHLIIQKDSMDLTYFSKNSQWDVSNHSVAFYSFVDESYYPPTLKVHLYLKRRHDFFLVYIIVPILFLAIINNLVFLLPSSSGERTSVAVTVFLSFVVYMDVINSSVPESSAPVAYIYYYILFLLVYSSSILFLCIVSLRIHDKTGSVPEFLKSVVLYLRLWCVQKGKTQKESSKVSPKEITVKEYLGSKTDIRESIDFTNTSPSDVKRDLLDDVMSKSRNDVTWHEVGKTFDIYCTIVLYITLISVSLNTLVNLYNNTSF